MSVTRNDNGTIDFISFHKKLHRHQQSKFQIVLYAACCTKICLLFSLKLANSFKDQQYQHQSGIRQQLKLVKWDRAS